MEVQMAGQEGNGTEMISQGRVWGMLNQKQKMQRCLWSGCKDASPHLSGFWCFYSCIISSSDDRIESPAILRRWLLAHDYGCSVFSEFNVAQRYNVKDVFMTVPNKHHTSTLPQWYYNVRSGHLVLYCLLCCAVCAVPYVMLYYNVCYSMLYIITYPTLCLVMPSMMSVLRVILSCLVICCAMIGYG